MPEDNANLLPLFGRPFQTSTAGDQDVYDRPTTFSPHPGYYDDAASRRAERQAERALPHREKLRPGASTILYNSLGMSDNLWVVENARATFTLTPATGTTLVAFALDRDLTVDSGNYPMPGQPGASSYLGVRSFAANAVATTATGDIAWGVQIGNSPFLSVGTTPASPASYFLLVQGFVPYPLNEDRILVGTNVGNVQVTGDTIATPVAIRVTIGFTLLYSAPPDR